MNPNFNIYGPGNFQADVSLHDSSRNNTSQPDTSFASVLHQNMMAGSNQVGERRSQSVKPESIQDKMVRNITQGADKMVAPQVAGSERTEKREAVIRDALMQLGLTADQAQQLIAKYFQSPDTGSGGDADSKSAGLQTDKDKMLAALGDNSTPALKNIQTEKQKALGLAGTLPKGLGSDNDRVSDQQILTALNKMFKSDGSTDVIGAQQVLAQAATRLQQGSSQAPVSVDTTELNRTEAGLETLSHKLTGQDGAPRTKSLKDSIDQIDKAMQKGAGGLTDKEKEALGVLLNKFAPGSQDAIDRLAQSKQLAAIGARQEDVNTFAGQSKTETGKDALSNLPPVGDVTADSLAKSLVTEFSKKNIDKTAILSTATVSTDLKPGQAAELARMGLTDDPKPTTDPVNQVLKSFKEELDSQKEAGGQNSGHSLNDVRLAVPEVRSDAVPDAGKAQPIKADQPPDELNPSRLIGQIVERAAVTIKNGTQSLRIALDPPNLGHLDVDVRIHENQVRATLVADSSSVKEALEQNLSQLKESFAQHGLKIDKFEVFVNPDPQRQPETRQQEGFSQRRNRGTGQSEEPLGEVKAVGEATELTRSNPNQALVNLFI
ncbi:MAG: flagellar hook-length control protein FliK [Deltaproteobacteria bacterium]|nr:flagellar hook-length control protein FliK [Deltaproteobacteria bacterium]